MSAVDPKTRKAKTLSKIKKLREAKMLAKTSDIESGESEADADTDFLTSAVEKMKSDKAAMAKPKVVIMDDGDEELDDNAANEDESAMLEEDVDEEIAENEEIEEEAIEEAPVETDQRKPKMVKRPYRCFSISIGFPDSVIQKCQVANFLQVF